MYAFMYLGEVKVHKFSKKNDKKHAQQLLIVLP